MTKREALILCIELWTWLADNTGKEKDQWPGWEDAPECHAYCPCCEYVIEEYGPDPDGNINCAQCLLDWPGKLALRCDSNHESPYIKWRHHDTPSIDKSKAALEIVALAQKALNELEETE